MGTFVRYLVYVALIVVAAFIIQGIWFDEQNDNDVVVEVGEVIPVQQPTIAQRQAQPQAGAKVSLPAIVK